LKCERVEFPAAPRFGPLTFFPPEAVSRAVRSFFSVSLRSFTIHSVHAAAVILVSETVCLPFHRLYIYPANSGLDLLEVGDAAKEIALQVYE
jgi:hypothetical protein